MTLWDAASGRVIGRPITAKPPGTGGAQWISFSPDSKRIAVPGAPGTVGIWEVATGRRVGKPLRDRERGRRGGDLRPGWNRTLIASDDSGSVSFVDIANRTSDPPAAIGRQQPAGSLDLSPDGRLLAAGFVRGAGVRVGRRRPARRTARRSRPARVRATMSTFSPDGTDPRELAPPLRQSSGTWTESRRSAGRSADRPT